MIGSVRAEWGKAWSVRAPLLCLIAAVLVAMATAFALANDVLVSIADGKLPGATVVAPLDSAGMGAQIGLVVFAAFAMLLVTGEYQGRSMSVTLQAQPRRGVLLAAKTIVAAAVGLAVGLGLGAASAAVSVAVLGAHAQPGTQPAIAGLRVGMVFAVAAPLVVALGVLLRRSVGALVAAFVLLFGSLALPSATSLLTPAGAAAAFIGQDVGTMSGWSGLGVVASWSVLLSGIALWWFSRRDA